MGEQTLLQALKHELNYHWTNEINTVHYDTHIKSTFRSFDKNGSNYIELGEFIVGLQILCPFFSVQDCVVIFKTIIKADPRRISLDEFTTTMRIEMDAKKYIKIHNWFESILQHKGATKNNGHNGYSGYSGLISIDHFIQYFMETDSAMVLV